MGREPIISRTLIIPVIRTSGLAFIESRASAPLMLTSLGACAAGAMLPYSPFAGALGFVLLPPLFWPILALMVLAYLALTHIIQVWFHRRFGLN